MNKADLIDAVVTQGIAKKDAAAAVKAVFDSIGDALAKGDKVQLIGFGTFEVRAAQTEAAIGTTQPDYPLSAGFSRPH